MISLFLEKKRAPGNSNDSTTTSSATNSSKDKPIGKFGSRKRCWQARGSFRNTYKQELVPQITGLLERSFAGVPGTELCTLSLYMIGTDQATAIPTVLFISRNEQSRKRVRNLLKESGILEQYPEFKTEYVNNDPGSRNVVILSSDVSTEHIMSIADSDVSTEHTMSIADDAEEVLFDHMRPLSALGNPVFIRRDSGLRPATANAVWNGDTLALQTVLHAFSEDPISIDMPPITVDEDLVIDTSSESESEAEAEFDQEAHVDTPIKPSQSPNDSSYGLLLSSSVRSDRKMSSEDLRRAARLDATHNDPPHNGNSCPLGQVHPAITTSSYDVTDTTGLIGSSFSNLVVLGKLGKHSVKNDLALIDITNVAIREKLRSIVEHDEHDRLKLAYDQIAPCPKDDAKVFTHTASSGKLRGTLSNTPVYTLLKGHESFSEMYAVRLDGPLATGDCGSAIIDERTGDTYGHLVAGCKTTGTAYILAPEAVEKKDCPSACHAESGLLRKQQRPRRHRHSKSDHPLPQNDHPDSDDTDEGKKSGTPRPESFRARRTGKHSTPTKKHSSKTWNSLFFQEREVADISFRETHKMTGSKLGLVEAFLQEDSNPVPSRQRELGKAWFATGSADSTGHCSSARAWVYRHTQSKDLIDSGACRMTPSQLTDVAFKKQVRHSSRKFHHNLTSIGYQRVPESRY